jgi:hypothetical protein
MVVNSSLTEELFQHIWKFRLFKQEGLNTVNGEKVTVLHPGHHNHHEGPDFKAARLRIGNTLWIGNVELHLKTSDWFRHGHQHNPRYNNIILHVVFEHDMAGSVATDIPCIALQEYIPKLLLKRYDQLRQSPAFVPCAFGAEKVPLLTWYNWKERLLAERWERKTSNLQAWLVANKYNWEEVCYWAIAQSLGTPVNAVPFLELAQSLPLPLLIRHKPRLMQLEALLFGQAGLLTGTFKEDYPRQLQTEYRFLQHKYQLKPMQAHSWNWLRMRPAAFPSMRIATFAALLHQSSHLFSRILEMTNIQELEQLFSVQPSPYWKTHYRFDHEVEKASHPGRLAVHTIIINTILPLLFLYGKQKGLPEYQERALHLLSQLPAEDNKITAGWQEMGVSQQCALESQALLQLKQYYCDEKRCLQCAIGSKLLREGII